MSNAATIAVWRLRGISLTATDRYVLLALADEADSAGYVDGRARRSPSYLAEKTDLSRRTIERAVAGLIERAVVVELNPPKRGGKRGGEPGEYLLPFIATDASQCRNGEDERCDTLTQANGHPDASVAERASSLTNPGVLPGTSDLSEARRLCDVLADLIEANGSKRPNVSETWVRDMDRMLRLDDRTAEQVENCIRWCQADEFWRANILSPSKLRAKFDQLRLQAKARGVSRATRTPEKIITDRTPRAEVVKW